MALFKFGNKKDFDVIDCSCGKKMEVTDCGCGEMVATKIIEEKTEKNKEYSKPLGCACGCCEPEIVEEKSVSQNMNIKVLGSGCKKCHALLEATKEAVENLKINATVEYVTDMEKVMSYGVMVMPALVLNEKVVSAGKVLKAADIEKLLK